MIFREYRPLYHKGMKFRMMQRSFSSNEDGIYEEALEITLLKDDDDFLRNSLYEE